MIGPNREESNRSLYYKKDISILARSGFSYEISKKVLEIPKKEFEKFCKMLWNIIVLFFDFYANNNLIFFLMLFLHIEKTKRQIL